MVDKWKEKASAMQENFSHHFLDRTWDMLHYPSQNDLLWKKIAYALYGPPRNTTEDGGSTSDEKKVIHELQDKCIRYSREKYDDVCIAIIFVCVRDKDGKAEVIAPLIRVMRNNSADVTNSYFIDHTGRVYHSWSAFLNENIWDGYLICVPNKGKYSNHDNAVFYDQRHRGEVLKVIDDVSAVTNAATGIAGIIGLGLSLFPPTAPIGGAILLGSAIIGAPGAIYGAGRSIETLKDRKDHDKSINPFESAEARGAWLVTAASALSVATAGGAKVLTSSAQAGNIASRATMYLVTSLHITAISVSGLGVIHGFGEVAKKDEVTALDILQLTTSIFFFSHTFINFNTANGLIKDAQRSKINSMKAGLNESEAQAFDALLKGTQEVSGETRKMRGNAQFIKEVKNIANKREFFSQFEVLSDGQLHIHGELTMDAKAYIQMSESNRTEILQLSRKLKNKEITLENFNNKVFKEFRLKFDQQIRDATTNACRALGVQKLEDFKVNNQRIFRNIKQNEISRLDQVLSGSCKNYNKNCIKLGTELANCQDCRNVTQFCATLEYAVRQLDARVKELREIEPKPKGLPQGVKLKDYFQQKAFDEFMDGARLDALNQKFLELRRTCNEFNEAGNPRFADSSAAANHYDKHNFFPKIDSQNLPPERYFEIAREMTSGNATDFKWTQDGSAIVVNFKSEDYGAVAIRYDNLANGTSVIATLMHDPDKKTIRTQMYNG